MFVKILELCWGLNGIIHKEYLHWAYVIVCHCEYYYQLLGNGLTIKKSENNFKQKYRYMLYRGVWFRTYHTILYSLPTLGLLSEYMCLPNILDDGAEKKTHILK